MSAAHSGIQAFRSSAVQYDILPPESYTRRDRAVYAQRVHMLYSLGNLSFGVNIILAAALVIVLWEVVAYEIVLGWLAVILFVSLLRARLNRLYGSASPSIEELPRWGWRYVFGVFCSGLSWGIGSVVIFPPDSIQHQVFIAFVLAGIAAGSVTLLASMRGAVFLYVGACILPLTVCFFLQGSMIHWEMGVLTIVFMIAILKSGSLSANSITQGLTYRFENEELVSHLKKAKEETEVLNFELKKEIEVRSDVELQLRDALEDLDTALKSAEAASSAKSSFIAQMSHEIRTPMNAIMGMTELALGSELDKEQREQLETVKISADSLLKVINDILDFSKIEAGKLELEKVPFSIRTTVKDASTLLSVEGKRKDVTINWKVDDDTPDSLVGDPNRLKQVLINLLSNAVKFSESGGEVELSVSRDGGSDNRVKLLFSVSDEGIGIPADKKEVIFESFTQAEGYITRRFGGTGLGLAVTSQLVQIMDGKIWVESQPGKGSTFYFTAYFDIAAIRDSLEQPTATESVTRDAPKPSLGSLKILLAEDNEINRKLVVFLLEKQGHQVTVVTNGQEAISKISEREFDAVLMDCQMPIMDGYEAAARIREIEKGSSTRVPIIALTAHAMKGDRERCLQAGMDDYVAKPISSTDLTDALTRVYRNGS